MGIEQHSGMKHWTPDEVAECVGGLGEDIGRRLWLLVQETPQREEPVVEKRTWWRRLSPEDQTQINERFAAEYGD